MIYYKKPGVYRFLFLLVIVFSTQACATEQQEPLLVTSKKEATNPKAFYFETTSYIKAEIGNWEFKTYDLVLNRIASFTTDGLKEQVLFSSGTTTAATARTITLSHLSTFEYDEHRRLKTKNTGYSNGIKTITYSILTYKYAMDEIVPTSAEDVIVNGDVAEHKWKSDTEKKHIETITKNGIKDRQLEWLNQQVVTETYFETTGAIKSSKKLKYNKDKLLEQSLLFSSNDSLVSKSIFTYLFNDKGDWIKRIEHKHQTGKFILTERKITYQKDLQNWNEQAILKKSIWKSPNSNFTLFIEEGNKFSLVDEDKVSSGKFSVDDTGQLNLKYADADAVYAPFNHSLTCSLKRGWLTLFINKSRFNDLLYVPSSPTTDKLYKLLAFEKWKKTTSLRPGVRDPEAIPFALRKKYAKIYAISPNRFSYYSENGKEGIIDGDDNVIIPLTHGSILLFNYDHFVVIEEGIGTLFDLQGKEVPLKETLMIYHKNSHSFDLFGRQKKDLRYYEDIKTYGYIQYEKGDVLASNGLRKVVRQDIFWLLTDNNFNLITHDSTYSMIEILTTNRYLVKDRRTSKILDIDGKIITSFKSVKQGSYGYLIAYSNGLSAIVDYDGNKITDYLYSEIRLCRDKKYEESLYWELRKNKALARYVKPNGEVGYLTGLGTEVKKNRK